MVKYENMHVAHDILNDTFARVWCHAEVYRNEDQLKENQNYKDTNEKHSPKVFSHWIVAASYDFQGL